MSGVCRVLKPALQLVFRFKAFAYAVGRAYDDYCWPLKLSLVVLFSISFGTATNFGQSNSISADWRSMVFSDAFELKDRTFPFISNGYLVSYRPILSHPTDAIRLVDLDTGLRRDVTFPMTDANPVLINDVEVTTRWTLLVAGSVGQRQIRESGNFIAELNMTGQTLVDIRLGTYEPEGICTTSDGSIWTLGRDPKPDSWNTHIRCCEDII